MDLCPKLVTKAESMYMQHSASYKRATILNSIQCWVKSDDISYNYKHLPLAFLISKLRGAHK